MIPERTYQRTTYKQLHKCIRWCMGRLNLRDWQITLILVSNENGDFGNCKIISEDRMLAYIWVNAKLLKGENCNPYVTVCHEMIHVLTGGKCQIGQDKDEPIARTFEDSLYKEYCNFARIKIMPLGKG